MVKVVMGLSGGMDSATLLGYYLNKGAEVHVCNFQYGSKHNRFEREAMIQLVRYYQCLAESKDFRIVIHGFNMEHIFSSFSSNLLKSGGKIPEGHYTDENMKKTVVPGRNTIFSSVMLGLSESLNANIIALGVHAGDHAIYPDCRADYIDALNLTIKYASDHKIKVEAPFINMDKTDILKLGYSFNPPTPYHLTRTCYKDQLLSCGKCGSCVERLEAFENLKIKDPIKYE